MNLHDAARAALNAMQSFESGTNGLYEGEFAEEIAALRAALAEPVQEPVAWKPLTEEGLEKAYREIWRDLPSDFDHTSSGWIEQGIRYAERAHGIGAQDEP